MLFNKFKKVRLSEIVCIWEGRYINSDINIKDFLDGYFSSVGSSKELEDSIKKYGIKKPIIVVPYGEDWATGIFPKKDKEIYLLVDGHHRYFIAMKLGLRHIPIRFPTREEMRIIIWRRAFNL